MIWLLILFLFACNFVSAACLWLLVRVRQENHPDFVGFIWFSQLRLFLLIFVLMLLVNIAVYFIAPRRIPYEEIFCLLALKIGLVFLARKTSRSVWKICTILLGGYIVALFSLVLVMGMTISLYIIFSMHSPFAGFFCAAASWVWMVCACYFYALGRVADFRKGIHHYLWPVMLAYLVLLAPLKAQEIINSPKFQDSLKARPLKII